MMNAIVSCLMIWGMGKITDLLVRRGVKIRRRMRILGELSRRARPAMIGFLVYSAFDWLIPDALPDHIGIGIELAWAAFWIPIILIWAIDLKRNGDAMARLTGVAC
ncbi:hypothetical protein ACOI1H_16115 [Loktanella sp. DJP18]|uniref:hypothetical protein n=1 Tax=Loktanella sp. DJP18 TaxID=3409788 RepID=UPI003BB4EE1E